MWPATDEMLNQPPHWPGGDQGIASGRGPHREQDLLRRRVLEQESAGTSKQAVEDVLVQVEGREQHDPRRLRRQRGHPPGGLDPVEPRHAHVHHHDIGPELCCLADCRQPVGRLADHLEVRLRADHHGHACPDHRLVVDYQDTDGHGGPGRNARTAKPRPAALPASSWPPSKRARSLSPASPTPPPGAGAAPAAAPGPSSVTSTMIPSSRQARWTVAAAPAAYRIALVRLSCTTR